MLIDSHCHIEHADFPDIASVVDRARAQGVRHAVAIGQLQPEGGFGAALDVAMGFPEFFSPTMGIHPQDAALASASDWEELERLVALPQVVGIGETGLDTTYHSVPLGTQVEALRRHLRLAARLGKPVVLHIREAHRQIMEVLTSERSVPGVVHCFTGTAADAVDYLALGLHVSISGIVTFPKSVGLQDAVRTLPLDRLLIETDSPYLSPVPKRGQKPNEPSFVVYTARYVAMLLEREEREIASVTSGNAVRLFGLKLPFM